jgi:hypothetical protein
LKWLWSDFGAFDFGLPTGGKRDMPFLSLDAIAAKRCEGLRPELRALFERLATAPSHDPTVRSDGMVQSGPDPVSAKSQTPSQRRSNADSAAALPPGAACGQNHQAELKSDT